MTTTTPEWAANVASLADATPADRPTGLTAEGTAFKAELEERTDRIALTAYEALDDDEIERLIAR